jgi:hypothetical protein
MEGRVPLQQMDLVKLMSYTTYVSSVFFLFEPCDCKKTYNKYTITINLPICVFKANQIARDLLHEVLDHFTGLLTIAAKVLSPKYKLKSANISSVTIKCA